MKIINVVEEVSEFDLRVNSFPIMEIYTSSKEEDVARERKSVQQAEDLFWKLSVENGAEDDPEYREVCIEDGVWTDYNGYAVFLIWSE